MELGRQKIGVIIGDAQSFVKRGIQGMKKDLSCLVTDINHKRMHNEIIGLKRDSRHWDVSFLGRRHS